MYHIAHLGQGRMSDSLEPKLLMVVNHHVVLGNQVFCKSNKYSHHAAIPSPSVLVEFCLLSTEIKSMFPYA